MTKRNDHGPLHAAMVCLIVTKLGFALALEDVDIARLQVAACLHDLGRVNNCDDAGHGARSLVVAKSFGVSVPPQIEQVIECHSRGDRTARHLDSETQRLLYVFKDADAIERVRTEDLDISYLRHRESVSLIPIFREISEVLR